MEQIIVCFAVDDVLFHITNSFKLTARNTAFTIDGISNGRTDKHIISVRVVRFIVVIIYKSHWARI